MVHRLWEDADGQHDGDGDVDPNGGDKTVEDGVL